MELTVLAEQDGDVGNGAVGAPDGVLHRLHQHEGLGGAVDRPCELDALLERAIQALVAELQWPGVAAVRRGVTLAGVCLGPVDDDDVQLIAKVLGDAVDLLALLPVHGAGVAAREQGDGLVLEKLGQRVRRAVDILERELEGGVASLDEDLKLSVILGAPVSREAAAAGGLQGRGLGSFRSGGSARSGRRGVRLLGGCIATEEAAAEEGEQEQDLSRFGSGMDARRAGRTSETRADTP